MSEHWYDDEGKPAYTVIGANGKERPTTLRDAKKLKLVPSVTTITACAAAPGLVNWKIDQAILSALTLTREPGEAESDYLARVKRDAAETSRKARERGTEIHAEIERGFAGGGGVHYAAARDVLDTECGPQQWITEASFATAKYGGKADLHCLDYLIDIKTTEKDLVTIKTWDEHAMQLAAYDTGLPGPPRQCGILFSHAITAEAKIIWLLAGDLNKGWECFCALLEYWYAKNWGDK